MSAKQFQHFMDFQRQLAGMQRLTGRKSKSSAPVDRASTLAVAEAKEWLSGARRSRSRRY